MRRSEIYMNVCQLFRYFVVGMKNLLFLLRHELRMEFRQKHALAAILLFTLSTIYVVYQAAQRIDSGSTWNALLWIILLFASFQAIGKSFQSENSGVRLYIYQLVSPRLFILSKLLYNVIVMIVLGFFSLITFMLFMGADPLPDGAFLNYFLGVILGSMGFGALLTLISGIAAQANSGMGLTSILGLPLTIPLILIIMKFSSNVMQSIPFAENVENLIFLGVLNLGMMALTYVLFPYLWRE